MKFNECTDTWFDTVCKYMTGPGLDDPEAVFLYAAIKAAKPNRKSLGIIDVQLRRTALPLSAKTLIGDQITAVLRSEYRNEFKCQFGVCSQASELLSMLRQAWQPEFQGNDYQI